MMKYKREIVISLICSMVLGFNGCKAESSTDDIQKQGETKKNIDMTNDTTSGSAAGNTQKELKEDKLEEKLKDYRQEREDGIVKKNGLMEAGSPNEENYDFDLSGTSYLNQFDTREMTEGYKAARIYVTDTLTIKPNTKIEVYMCVDPRVLSIYEDKDKGVANGYDNNNIFLAEYCDENNIWQSLILVREGKGSSWKVIYSGKGYKE